MRDLWDGDVFRSVEFFIHTWSEALHTRCNPVKQILFAKIAILLLTPFRAYDLLLRMSKETDRTGNTVELTQAECGHEETTPTGKGDEWKCDLCGLIYTPEREGQIT